MPKPLKIILIALGVLLALMLAAAAYFAATFNPNDYKPQLIRLVQEKKQRTLEIPGDIKLSFFPKLGVDLGKLRLSEHGGSGEFLSVESAKVSLALLPLLSKRYVVDQVRVDGLRAHIVKFKDGSTNYDDLLAKDEATPQPQQQPQQEPVSFDVGGVRITNGSVLYEDRQAGRTIDLSKLQAETGRIADNADSRIDLSADVRSNTPQADAKLGLKSGFRFDRAAKRAAFKDMALRVDGAVAGIDTLSLQVNGSADLRPEAKRVQLDGIKLVASGKEAGKPIDVKLDIPQLTVNDKQVTSGKIGGELYFTSGTKAISAVFNAPAFDGSPDAFRLPAINLDLGVKDGELDARAKVSGALSGDIGKLAFSSPKLNLALSGQKGSTVLRGSLTTPLVLDLEKKLVELSNIAVDFTLPNPRGGPMALTAAGKANYDLGKKDGSATLKGKLDESSFDAKLGLAGSPSRYRADIGIDRIDVDRYLAQAPAPVPAPKAPAPASAPEKPFDLSALQDLHADGAVRIGALKVKNIRSANVRFALHADSGKVNIDPFNASLYGGTVSGAMSAAATHPARFTLRQTLTGIAIGPLLKDATGKDPLEGKGNVALDVITSGDTATALRRALGGTARLE
ncbi:AsmA family protein, partial [Oxalobacteraceae bacterium OM1]